MNHSRPEIPTRRRALLALLACGTCLPARAAPRTPGEVEIGQVLRQATLLGLNGPSRKLSEFRGKPLIINVWASWCGPCRAEMGSLERLAWHEQAGSFGLIGISTDDYPQAALAFLKQTRATITHYIDQRLELEHMLGATQLPLTVLVDAGGRVIDKVYGARAWDSPETLKMLARQFGNRKIAPA